MTYQEIQDRLSKCESTLEQLKNGSVKPTEKITVKNLILGINGKKPIYSIGY